MPEEVDFFDPPSTHLEGATNEVGDTKEEVGDSTDSRLSAKAPSHKWLKTSTYNCYMVDTPIASNGGGNDGGDNINDNGNANGNDCEVPPRTEPHGMDSLGR